MLSASLLLDRRAEDRHAALRLIKRDVVDEQVFHTHALQARNDGDRQYPVLNCVFEATSIDRRVKNYSSPRPLTHDFLVNSVEALRAELDSVVISELREHTYFPHLGVKQNGELVEIDARPADEIAVAVTCDPPLPIYVAE